MSLPLHSRSPLALDSVTTSTYMYSAFARVASGQLPSRDAGSSKGNENKNDRAFIDSFVLEQEIETQKKSTHVKSERTRRTPLAHCNPTVTSK